MTLPGEEGLLKLSIAATLVVAGLGIAMGFWTGSRAIVFDGTFSLVDAAMSALSLMVVGLVKSYALNTARGKELEVRFNYGFWHLEPMVLALNGLLLMAVAIYGLLNAIESVLSGGRVLDFDLALYYAIAATVICLSMAAIGYRANRKLKSAFVRLDAQGWLSAGALSAALVVAFVIATLIEDTAHLRFLPYIDPVVLGLICLVLIPVPAAIIRNALADMFLVTPTDLRARVDAVGQAITEKYGFQTYRGYAARVGRAQQIEIYFIVPRDQPPRPLEAWDAIRNEVGAALGSAGPDRWLTVTFTADPRWSE
ncbi:MAG: cation diffusion facilitator family transporter [Roseinatronobacter sp.]